MGQYTFKIDSAYESDQLDLPDERWADVPEDLAVEYGFQPGIMKGIRISNLGRVQDKRGRRSFGSELPSDADGDCYKMVKIGHGEGRVTIRVHVLCALTFVGRRPTPVHTVDHIDGRKKNNAASNLRWSTPSEQGQNQRSNRAVHQLDLQTGRIIRTFATIAEAARITKCHKAGINMVCLGTRAKSGSYAWKYST